MLFDTHTHLNNDSFTDEERVALAAEIEASDVGLVRLTSCSCFCVCTCGRACIFVFISYSPHISIGE